jgi:hypothetical protein
MSGMDRFLYFGYGLCIAWSLIASNWPALIGWGVAILWFHSHRQKQKVIDQLYDGLQAIKSGMNHEIGEI